MQRYIARRALQSLLAIWVMSLIVFSLARVTGNPLDVMLPLEAGARGLRAGLEALGARPAARHPVRHLPRARPLRGDFGNSWKWHGHSAMGLVWQRLPATLQLAGFALLISIVIALPIGVLSAVMKGTALGLGGEDHRPARPVPARLLAGHRADVDLRRAPRVVPDLGPGRAPAHDPARHHARLVPGRRPHAAGRAPRCWRCWTASS